MHKAVVILSFFFLFSCSASTLRRDKFVVLGTYLEVLSSDERAAEIVYQEFIRLDSIFNKYDKHSQLSKVNNNPGKRIEVSQELLDLTVKSKEYYQLSGGIFDISKGKLYNFWKEWGKDKEKRELPSEEKIKELVKSANIEGIEVDFDQKTIKVKEGVVLDFSGVAKGYIVDKAIEKLRAAGIESALVNAGGDMYCLGKNNNKPWQVGVRSPSGSLVKTLELSDRGVATSGNYHQIYKRKGKLYSHLIDPRDGYPVERDLLGVTVIADKSWQADALATILFISGKESLEEIIESKDSEVAVYFISED